MPIYPQIPVRLQASIISDPPVVPTDANTGKQISFWRAQGINISVGIFDANGVAVDLSNLQYLQLIIQESQDALVASVVKQVDAGSIIPVITKAGWDAGIAQQA